MSIEFNSDGDDLKIEAGVKRLTPFAKRGDIYAFADRVRSLQSRYGHEIADESMRRVIEQFPSITTGILEAMPLDMQAEFYAKSVEVIIPVLDEAGLRLEDHLRVTDRGIGLTKESVRAIAAAGFPDVARFGEGNNSLEGMGLNRLGGFVHPLSEATKATKENGLPEDCLNLWFCASVVISGAQGWMEADKGKCLGSLQELISRSAPTADLGTLLSRSRYDDRVLLRLCSLVHAGLESKAQRSME